MNNKKNKKIEPSLRERFNHYLENRSNGREIPAILGMLFICLVTCVYLVYDRETKPESEKETIGTVMDKITPPEYTDDGKPLPSLSKLYQETENDKQMLAIVRQLQIEVKKTPPDLELIKALQIELKTLSDGK